MEATCSGTPGPIDMRPSNKMARLNETVLETIFLRLYCLVEQEQSKDKPIPNFNKIL